MKKAALFICLLAFCTACFAQQDSVQAPKTAEELQRLSIKQKKTANAFLIAGSISAVTGPLIVFISDREASLPLGGAMLVAGLGAMVVSVPFYIASGNNKRRAKELSMVAGWEMIDDPVASTQISNGFPAVKLRLKL